MTARQLSRPASLLVLVLWGAGACSGATVSESEPIPTVAPGPTPTPPDDPTPAPSPTPESTPTPGPSADPTPTPEPDPTPTPEPDPTPTPEPDPTPTPTSRPTPTPTPEPTPCTARNQCIVQREPGAGTAVCPGDLFERSCFPMPGGGTSHVTYRCVETGAPGGRFDRIDDRFCTATSGVEAGQHFCPGTVIERNGCDSGGQRRFFICPDDAERDARFAPEVDLGCEVESGAWEPLHRGIALRRWTRDGHRLRALRAELCAPGVRVVATRSDDRGQRTSDWAESVSAVAAINGGFFTAGLAPDACLAAGGGQVWDDSNDGGARSTIAFGPGQVAFSEAPNIDRPPYPLFPWIEEAVCGDATIVRDGVGQPNGNTSRRARTAAGLSADRRTLYLLTVDERNSRGMTVAELGAELAALGADFGINLDGGGSTTLWTRAYGSMNSPSDGRERTVANHLGLIIDGAAQGRHCPAP